MLGSKWSSPARAASSAIGEATALALAKPDARLCSAREGRSGLQAVAKGRRAISKVSVRMRGWSRERPAQVDVSESVIRRTAQDNCGCWPGFYPLRVQAQSRADQ